MEDIWRPHECLIAHCVKCGREGLKRNMSALYIKDRYTQTPKRLCHLCYDCLPQLLDDLEVSMPE